MGRRIGSYAIVVGVAIAAAIATVAALYAGGLPLADVVFLSTLFTLLGFGLRAAWIAWRSARRAAEDAERTVSRTTEDAVHAALDEERARVSADIEAVVRQAVLAIRARALAIERAGERSPSADAAPAGTAGRIVEAAIGAPAALREIQDQGRAATAELRRLLELLRSPYGDGESAAGPSPAPVKPREPLGRLEILPAVVASVVCLLEVLLSPAPGARSPSVAVAVLSVAVAAATLGWRRDPGLTMTTQALVVYVALGVSAPVQFGLWTVLALGLPMWAAVARPRPGALAVVGPPLLASAALTSQWITSQDNVAILAVILGVAALVGLVTRVLDARRRGSAARAAQHEAELARSADEAVRRDRVATARELHDAVSGTIGVIVMQAGAAELRWSDDRAAALRSVAVVVASADQALHELEHLLPRLDGVAIGGSARRGPRDLPAFLERMNRVGVQVSASMPDPLPDLPPEVAATAYRIAQEGVANAARHAPGSRIAIRMTVHDDAIEVSVEDDGPGRPARSGGGYGLAGLAERVAGVGGVFTAGPREGGGFHVAARLPVARIPETPA